MHALNHIIEQKQNTRVLGKVISNMLMQQEHINTVIRSINFRIHALHHISPFTSFQTRLHIANALIISTLTHLAPLLSNAQNKQLARLQTLQLKSARLFIGSHCFKWSTSHILSKCNWHSIYNIITEQSLYLLGCHLRNNLAKCIILVTIWRVAFCRRPPC